MKKIIIISILFLTASSAFAETLGDTLGFPFNEEEKKESYGDTETLLGTGELEATGFGGPFMTTSKINGHDAYFVGGRGAAIFNETFILGGGGCGLVYPTNRSDITGVPYQGNENYVHMGYGGVLVGINLMQKNIINLSATSLIGAGGISYSEYSIDDDECEQCEKRKDVHSDSEEFFVCEPTMMLHLNVTQWMRIGAGMSYRYTNGISVDDLSDNDFKNWSTVFAVDFGWF